MPTAVRTDRVGGLDVDVVEGEVWGAGKAAALRRHGAHLYVGDHVHGLPPVR